MANKKIRKKTITNDNKPKVIGTDTWKRSNSTHSVRAQLRFFRESLAGHQRELDKIKKYKKYNLPGYGKMLEIHLNAVKRAKTQLKNHETRVRKLQKEKKINKIL